MLRLTLNMVTSLKPYGNSIMDRGSSSSLNNASLVNNRVQDNSVIFFPVD